LNLMKTYTFRFVARSEEGLTKITESLASKKVFADLIRPSDKNLVLWGKLHANDAKEADKIAKHLHESHGQDLARVSVSVTPKV